MENAKAPLLKHTKSLKPQIMERCTRITFRPSRFSRSSSNMRSYINSAEGTGPGCPPGLSGLENLGNTCFINSVIQCLSNCGLIRNYFKENRLTNASYALGGAGLLTKTFADVIAMLWSGRHEITIPQHFQIELTTAGQQFAGSQQRDAHELLLFLLHHLDEDLKRAIEVMKEEYHGAQEEQAVIMENFHGMLKSTVTCNECGNVSQKYETFNTLSLPLPAAENTVTVRWLAQGLPTTEATLQVQVHQKAVVEDLLAEIAKTIHLKPDYLVLFGANVHHCLYFFPMDKEVETLLDSFKLYVCDLPEDDANDPYCNYVAAERLMKAYDHCGFMAEVYEFERSIENPQVLPIPRQIHLGFFPNKSTQEQFVSLEECFHRFVASENLEGQNAWECPSCSKTRRAQKKLAISNLPNILIIHLNRFTRSDTKLVEKNLATVRYPLNGLVVDTNSKDTYNLVAVCNHYGSLMEGHYTAYCKNLRDRKWYCFDDSSVTNIEPELVQTKYTFLSNHLAVKPCISQSVNRFVHFNVIPKQQKPKMLTCFFIKESKNHKRAVEKARRISRIYIGERR